MAQFDCWKCGGSGKVPFHHIENGVCFTCGGSGKLAYRKRERVEADPHPELLVPQSEMATDKQWGYLLRLVRDNEDAFCRCVKACGAKYASQRYITKAMMSQAIEMAKAGL